MGKYRKKPVVIEAVQYPCEHPALRRCKCDEFNKGKPHNGPLAGCSDCGRVYIQTLEGRMTVSPGDWIITGVHGEHYPCKPEIFAATYEPVIEQAEPHTPALLTDADAVADLASTPRPDYHGDVVQRAAEDYQADPCPIKTYRDALAAHKAATDSIKAARNALNDAKGKGEEAEKALVYAHDAMLRFIEAGGS